jgi:RNA polymerase sigma factor (TIGR02999 family)
MFRAMGLSQAQTITGLLQRWHEGDTDAASRLMPLVYDELRRLAESYLRRERRISICRTELVHELYLRLPPGIPELENRSHFFGIAARLMRQILVDLSREQNRLKRRPDPATIAFPGASPKGSGLVDVLVLDQCLDRLHSLDPRKAQIVELRSFGGFTVEEIAAALDLSLATVKRDWSVARLWLRRELDSEPKIGDSSPDDPGGVA